MEKYIWCTPILPGKSSLICDEWTQDTFDLVDPQHKRELEEMHDRAGLHDFNLWIQHTPSGDLLLMYWIVEDWDRMWSEFRACLDEGMPRAKRAHQQFLDVLGIDLSKEGVIPKPEMIGEEEFGKLPAKEVVRFAMAWPILEGREESRRTYAKSFDHEKRRKFKRLARKLGVISAARAITHVKEQSYYIVYQEVSLSHWDRYEEFMQGSHKREEWPWESLIEDTGLTREELIPHIEWVIDRAPVSSVIK